MRNFKRGQIWLVNFEPSFGHEYRKIRPAIIVQSSSFIDSSKLLTVVPISSQIKSHTQLDILVQRDSQNRLMKDSLVKIKQVSSFDKQRFIKLIGNVDKESMEKIDHNLQIFLNL